MELHPLCTLFPRMTGYELECLKLDIKENGLRTPITTYDGMILDGGNRYRACVELGIKPITEEYAGNNLSAFVLTSNLYRRHLLSGQQAAIVACVQDWAKAHVHGGDRKSAQVLQIALDTTKTRAEKSGASQGTQRKADAVAKKDPELAASVARGEISLNEATREVAPQLLPRQAPEEQEEPEYTELDAAHDQITDLQAQLVSGGLGRDDAETYVNGLLAEIKTLKAVNKAITKNRDDLQLECNQLKRQCAMQAKEIKKLKP